MQRKARKAYVPGAAVLLVALAAGCSSGGGTDGTATDAKAGGPTVSAAAPGKYRTLREPCGSVPRSTLKTLLPGIATLPKDQQEKAYQGTPAVTYDTDRRVGCSWKSDSPDESYQLSVDVERVVSYDPTVSDADQAQEIYAKKQDTAHLPSPSTSPAPDASNTTTPPASGAAGGSTALTGAAPGVVSGSASGSASASVTDSPSSSTPPGGPEEESDDLEPRRLDGLGDVAFLNDVLGGSGSTVQSRKVSVVFRTSNVIVTIGYTEQPGRVGEVPDRKELQEKARGLAKTLAGQFNE
ncbi:lipoprotein [Streptomyces sp. AcH 505]|uniref:hypothetical protein n=1 Tax=Streptomyces sp. AcH 505 TaxID=352211 RepID=UPI0005922213|nr:lipoprotein [Streptomyces sp. AcH 505]